MALKEPDRPVRSIPWTIVPNIDDPAAEQPEANLTRRQC